MQLIFINREELIITTVFGLKYIYILLLVKFQCKNFIILAINVTSID